jgi:hypothetical protein
MVVDRVRQCEKRVLCARIISEFVDMPGLTITMAEACRLWDIDEPRCKELLNTLAASGFLRKSGDSYMRADYGWCAA